MPFIDIHCHPSMMMYLANGDLETGNFHCLPANIQLNGQISMLTSLNKLAKGNVNAAVSVHYLPEQQILTEMKSAQLLIKLAVPGLNFPIRKLLNKFDVNDSATNFRMLLRILDEFNEKVKAKPSYLLSDKDGKKNNYTVVIAKDYADFVANSAVQHTIVFVTSIEGMNGLGYKLDPHLTAADVCSRLEFLINHYSLCQLTIGHAFENILVSSSGGFPPMISKKVNYKVNHPEPQYDDMHRNTYPNGYNPKIFHEVINFILDKGIIIDLVHTAPEARNEVYEINLQRGAQGKKLRPLVFSHSGVKAMAMKGNVIRTETDMDRDQNNQEILPTDSEIVKIWESGGVIGIVFMNYWLKGEELDKLCFPRNNTNGLTNVLLTIKHIASLCNGSLDAIAFGSDMDGFSSPPPDLNGADSIPQFLNSLLGQEYFRDQNGPRLITQLDIDQMAFGNYLRVLQLGWGV